MFNELRIGMGNEIWNGFMSYDFFKLGVIRFCHEARSAIEPGVAMDLEMGNEPKWYNFIKTFNSII